MPSAGADWGEMIKLFYCTDANFGDAMSPMVVAKLSGQEVRPAGMWNADMMAIGSVFYRGDYFMVDTHHAGLKHQLKAAMFDFRRNTSRPISVWGSGFLQYPTFQDSHSMRSLKVFALRGLHTRKILESFELMRPDEKIAYGDPGLLFADLFDIRAKPKYDVGIVPHKFDSDQGWNSKLEDAFNRVGINAKVIDVTDNPLKVVSEIAKCEKIISSSLHGLIVADSLGIPNLHMTISTLGHSQRDYELKFQDYYSAFGEHMPNVVLADDLLGNPIKYMNENAYGHVNSCNINEAKDTLIRAFPFKERV